MLEQFKEPSAEYRMAPLWLWNEKPNPDEVERRIREMHSSGFGGFFIVERNHAKKHSNGEWLSSTDRACAVAAELGMFAGVIGSGQTEDNSSALPNIRQLEFHAQEQVRLKALTVENECPAQPQNSLFLREKLGVSMAHHSGLGRILSSPFEGSGCPSIEQMKAAIDREIALGINAFCPSTLLRDQSCSTPTFASSHFRHFADYTARLCYALSQGRHKAQIALLNPEKGLKYEHALNPQGPISRLIVDFFNLYCDHLIKQHLDYDILSEETIERALIVDQQMAVEEEDYQLLILPPVTAIGYSAAKKIAEYVEDGGALLTTNLLPFRDANGENHEEVLSIFTKLFDINLYQLRDRAVRGELRRQPLLRHNFGNLLFFESSDAQELAPCLRGAVQMAIKPEVSIRSQNEECHDVIYMHRSAGEHDLYFFLNTSPDPRSVKISIRCDKSPSVLDPETGKSTALANCTLKGSRTVFEYRFRRHESLLVHFSDDILLPAAPKMTGNGYEIALANEWDFQLDGPNNIALSDWHINSLPHQKNTNELVTAFYVESKPGDLRLLLSALPPDCRRSVCINDQQVDKSTNTSSESEEYNISGLIRTPHNVIRLAVEYQPDGKAGTYVGIKARLTGDFSLIGSQPVLSAHKNRIKNGSWTDQGYPFYSGSATYSQEIEIPAFYPGQKVFLRADEPAEVVEFIVNNQTAAVRLWPPYEADITNLVRPGRNQIQLKVTNTPANACLNEIRASGLLRGARIVIC